VNFGYLAGNLIVVVLCVFDGNDLIALHRVSSDVLVK
jgi:hypothetical protein